MTITRRDTLKVLAAASAGAAGCSTTPEGGSAASATAAAAESDAVLVFEPLTGPPWKTLDPFLFCVHHLDQYPKGNERFGPAASLTGRRIGHDFAGKDGWRMYHGQVVPGFPQHPHRGFETVTVVRRGLLDHADSMGAAARYGEGDVQWLTAGKGIQHAEMFPLLKQDADNPVELFQLWLNLPKKDKMVDPYFTMIWAPKVPHVDHVDSAGKKTQVQIKAGALGDQKPPSPPPSSWASNDEADVAIWTIAQEPGATWTLPAARPGTNRALYYFSGEGMEIGGKAIPKNHFVQLRPDRAVPLKNGPSKGELLLLQGRPIGEPVARYGPFVMNTDQELKQAMRDYRATQFGGWPWDREDPVHQREDRFARHATGEIERPA